MRARFLANAILSIDDVAGRNDAAAERLRGRDLNVT
jgi:hypothetical protein